MEHRAYGPHQAGVSAPSELPAAGWYADPHGPPGVDRWWSGAQWTEHTQLRPPEPGRPPMVGGAELADYASRMVGYLLDNVILAVISLVVLIPLGGAFHTTTITTGESDFTSFGAHGWGILVQVALVLLYGTLFVGSRRGQTPGMMAMGIQCVGADTGTSVGHGKACLRALVELLLGVALLIPGIVDMLFPLWDPKNQTIHDKSVGSLVVIGARRT